MSYGQVRDWSRAGYSITMTVRETPDSSRLKANLCFIMSYVPEVGKRERLASSLESFEGKAILRDEHSSQVARWSRTMPNCVQHLTRCKAGCVQNMLYNQT